MTRLVRQEPSKARELDRPAFRQLVSTRLWSQEHGTDRAKHYTSSFSDNGDMYHLQYDTTIIILNSSHHSDSAAFNKSGKPCKRAEKTHLLSVTTWELVAQHGISRVPLLNAEAPRLCLGAADRTFAKEARTQNHTNAIKTSASHLTLLWNRSPIKEHNSNTNTNRTNSSFPRVCPRDADRTVGTLLRL